MGGHRPPGFVGLVVACLLGGCANGASGSASGADAGGSPNLLGDGGVACTGLSCKQVDCAAMGKPPTTLSGIAYDPAGAVGLYNVFVYVPTTTPDPIPSGHPRCAQCQADATGHPLVYDSTDADGWFHVRDVPAGDDVPLVLQLGKWRRQIVLPHIDACVDNVLLDPNRVRLPAKASDGDMPMMALTTGCDAIECFLLSMGIDQSEFTGPSGPGHVHVYGGHYPGVSIPGMGDAYNLWASADRLAGYDMVLGACECAPFPRDTEGPAYEAMQQYLDSGGRFYSTHFHYNWFAPPTGPTAFQNIARWGSGDQQSAEYIPYFVDTSFPRGRAFADWLDANQLSPTYGQVTLLDARDSVEEVETATRWIYGADTSSSTTYEAKYLSFNTPLGAPTAGQCGRAVFSDVHVSGTSDQTAFPAECGERLDPHGVNQRALEFLFFDLVSCVQDDSQGPSQPPVH